jgi:predicted deacylase
MTAGKAKSFIESEQYHFGAKMRVPVLEITGAKDGPLLVVASAQHGLELNGVAAIEQAYSKIDPLQLTGRIVFLPVMNPLGVWTRRQEFPNDMARYGKPLDVECNMNRLWRADRENVPAWEITELVWERYASQAQAVVDLHGWSSLSMSLVWGNEDNLEMTRSFGLPCFMTVGYAETKGTLSYAAQGAGIRWVTCELASQDLLYRDEVRAGARGIMNILRYLGMLEGRLNLPTLQYEFAEGHAETLLNVPVAGLLVSDYAKGEIVRAGEIAARIVSLDNLDTLHKFAALRDSLLFNIGGAESNHRGRAHAVVFPGQVAGILKQVTREWDNTDSSIKR